MVSVNHFDLSTHPEVFDLKLTGLPDMRKASSPSTLMAELTKRFRVIYSLYI